jgi:hypothetical protein
LEIVNEKNWGTRVGGEEMQKRRKCNNIFHLRFMLG